MACIFDARSEIDRDGWKYAREIASFTGPKGSLFSDGHRLFAAGGEGLTIWEIPTGARTGLIPGFHPTHLHAVAKELVELQAGGLRRWRF